MCVFFKQKTAYEMRISDWSSDVCSSDLDAAQVLVQNRVALAEPRLPEQVRQIGVQVNKQETGFLMIVALTSTDPAIDIDYVGNYANSNLRDRLLRLQGVGGVQIFRSEEHTSELQSLMRISYAVFCLKKNNLRHNPNT